MVSSLPENRKRIASLLDIASPADAPTAYYALYHDPKRTELHVRLDSTGAPIGFVGRFQTGLDLFRPVVCMRCWQPETAADLLAEMLIVGRPYILFSNINQLPMVGGSLDVSNQRILSIYALDSARFRPIRNVLVVHKTSPDGSPRAEINSNGQRAVAGLNWQSPGFAEIYVHTDSSARQRGWGMSVAAACVERVLSGGRLPLYLVEPDNEVSVKIAESLGFVDTGARQIYADTVYLGHPVKRE